MRDEELGDEISRMLRARAARHPGHGDPVGLTRRHIAAAAARRRRAYAATATLAVAGALVVGSRAFAQGPGDGSATTAPTPRTATSAAPATSAPSGATPGPVVVTTVSPPDCASLHWPTAESYTWGTRGSLAGDHTLGTALVARAVSLTGGRNAKLAYAGQDASVRIAVVFVDMPQPQICSDTLAVLFHGPPGTAVAALDVQAGQAFALDTGADYAFTWSERNQDGSMSLLALEPPTTRKMYLDAFPHGGTSRTTVPTDDGTLLEKLPAGSPPPTWIAVDAPHGVSNAIPLNFAVTQDTRQAVADALAVDVSTVSKPDDRLSGYRTALTSYFLTPTRAFADIVPVFWGAYDLNWAPPVS